VRGVERQRGGEAGVLLFGDGGWRGFLDFGVMRGLEKVVSGVPRGLFGVIIGTGDSQGLVGSSILGKRTPIFWTE
jgi:hypothetical protein